MSNKFAVGQKVFVISGLDDYDPTYTPGTVQNITPSGLIDVLIGSSKEPTRFLRCELDTMPFEERERKIAETARIKSVAGVLSIRVEILRLEKALAKAKTMLGAAEGDNGQVGGREDYPLKNADLQLMRAAPDLLQAAKSFVRWVNACWGTTEILAPETLVEYEAAKAAIKSAEDNNGQEAV